MVGEERKNRIGKKWLRREREREREGERESERGQRVCQGNVINQLQLEKCSAELKKPDDSCVYAREPKKEARGGEGVGGEMGNRLAFLLKHLPKPHYSKACVGANVKLSWPQRCGCVRGEDRTGEEERDEARGNLAAHQRHRWWMYSMSTIKTGTHTEKRTRGAVSKKTKKPKRQQSIYRSFNSSFRWSESFNITEVNDISCPSLVQFSLKRIYTSQRYFFKHS